MGWLVMSSVLPRAISAGLPTSWAILLLVWSALIHAEHKPRLGWNCYFAQDFFMGDKEAVCVDDLEKRGDLQWALGQGGYEGGGKTKIGVEIRWIELPRQEVHSSAIGVPFGRFEDVLREEFAAPHKCNYFFDVHMRGGAFARVYKGDIEVQRLVDNRCKSGLVREDSNLGLVVYEKLGKGDYRINTGENHHPARITDNRVLFGPGFVSFVGACLCVFLFWTLTRFSSRQLATGRRLLGISCYLLGIGLFGSAIVEWWMPLVAALFDHSSSG